MGECSGNGVCSDGTCVCFRTPTAFTGALCERRLCPSNDVGLDCSGHGLCGDKGTCTCHEGFFGPDCGHHKCPNDCSGHGTCDTSTGKCNCRACQGCAQLWRGPDCSEKTCKDDCNNHGRCDMGNGDPACICDAGFSGKWCQFKTCINDCNKQGLCSEGVCYCYPGYHGASCNATVAAPRKTGPSVESVAAVCSDACVDTLCSGSASADCVPSCVSCCVKNFKQVDPSNIEKAKQVVQENCQLEGNRD